MVGALAGEADGDEQARMALVEAGLAGIEVYYGLYPRTDANNSKPLPTTTTC